MNEPCGIIQDLLPLYADGVCSEASRTAVEQHLAECDVCRAYHEAAKAADGFAAADDDKGEKMAKSLKQVRRRISRKIKLTVACSAAAAVLLGAALYVLYEVPLRSVDVSEVAVTAEVYPLALLPHEIVTEDTEVKISKGEADLGAVYSLTIPAMPNAEISVSENLLREEEAVTVVSWTSPHFLREIKWAQNRSESADTLYVEAFKTTVLGNKAPTTLQTTQSLDFRALERIVYVGGGEELVLWEKSE